MEAYRNCHLCPRECGADRTAGERGVCGMGAEIKAARAALHFWEEPCLSGTEGSGTVFFNGCPLGCIYCQNHEISAGQSSPGKILTEDELAEAFLRLQAQGANNINLVTAVHFIPSVRNALILAKERGLIIPVVYNSSGYEKQESLQMLEGLVDIWLPDFKYWEGETAAKYSRCPDYPEQAKEALREMVRQSGPPVFDAEGRMKRGIIVRHLVLPGQTGAAKRILRYLHDTYGDLIYISIMNQYTPMPGIEKQAPELARRVPAADYEKVISFALRIGIELAFRQEGEAAEESFIPAFDGAGL